MTLVKLRTMLKNRPQDLDDRCDDFKSCSGEEYRTLALYALRVLCRGKDFTKRREDDDGWAAHHISKAIFEEQEHFDPYADKDFLAKATKICPWYILRYLDDSDGHTARPAGQTNCPRCRVRKNSEKSEGKTDKIRLAHPPDTNTTSKTVQEDEPGKKLLNIYYLVQEFYAMEAVSALLAVCGGSHFEPMRHSHSRWREDFDEFRSKYISQFAAAIFDYTVLAVAGELRHCDRRASQHIRCYYSADAERNTVYYDCAIYNPGDILAAGIRLFDTDRVTWVQAYGGDKWRQIAKAGLMKDRVSDCVFIDHCVDLSHNNSVYFDKGAGIFKLGAQLAYQKFLDLKRTCEPQTLLSEKQGSGFNRLLLRANNLHIIDVQPEDVTADCDSRSKSEVALFAYQPIEWGCKRLDSSEANIVINRCFAVSRCDNDDNNRSREYARCA